MQVYEESQRTEGARRWWAALPQLVADLEREWDLQTGTPFAGGSASWVAPARSSDGIDGVLKVNLPHREARDEAMALASWDGAGAVRLYRFDRDRMALFVERCRPGVSLSACELPPEDALAAAATVLRRLWSAPVTAPSSYERLSDVTAEWAVLVRERMAEHRPKLDAGIVELGAHLLEQLPLDAGARTVLLHGDFNPGNVLSAEREPWLAIDAKPMVGDAGYDPVPMIGQVSDLYDRHDSDDVLLDRHRLFADLVDLPVDRVLAWAVARLVEVALWHVSRGEPTEAHHSVHAATRLARLAGL
jgi:streptomycin 6-kinase